jgi:methionyl aminopeptidase
MARRRPFSPRVPLVGAEGQEAMRRAGRVVALALHHVGAAITPGVTTAELDAVAEHTIRGLDAVPAFLGYQVGEYAYPATACISVNDEVVHGIPGPRRLKDGDIVSVDLGAIVDGWYGDAAYTFAVGTVREKTADLMETGQRALDIGIAQAKPGNRVRDIGAAIQQYVESRGYSVVRVLCGHGIGQRLHEAPQVPNYASRESDIVLRAGMALAIEPMVNAGGPDVDLEEDNWTYVTRDGALSVHYEHTVLIQPDGPEILTIVR